MSSPDHRPQLDGVRAVAIAAVVAYHLGYLPGGWIGVDVFFVLSGYLITSLLLAAGDPLHSRNGLWRFWGRRARRLLPAVLLLLLVLCLYARAGGSGLVPAQLRAPAFATLFYSANWQQIAAGHDYFNQFTAPSPLQHTWSLAIEEQYYLVWPLLLGGLVWGLRGRRTYLIAATGSLAVVSALWMGVAAHLFGANRAYLGTDTRAWELLLGGTLAMAFPPGREGQPSRAWSWAALAGAAVVAVGAAEAGGPPGWVWDGGLVAIAVCAGVVVVGSLRAPNGPVGRLLATSPLRWLGTVSYSLYLWHWPVIVLLTQATTGLDGGTLLLARLATMLAVSCVSYYAVEGPLRNLDWGAFFRRLRLPAAALATGVAVIAATVIVGATIGPPAARSATVSLAALAQPSSQVERMHVDLPVASPGNPYRVWIFGDSVMADSSLGVQAALQATGDVSVVLNSAFPGWGLSRDKDWPSDAEAAIQRHHPQIAIGTWSWDDSQAFNDPGAYLRRLESAMAAVLAPAGGVKLLVLLQFPQTGPSTPEADVSAGNAVWQQKTKVQDAWDDAARRAVAAFPGRALYLTTDQLFAPGGRFYTWFETPTGTWIRARKLDNTHFCPYGAAAFGALVTEDLAALLKLPPMAPGWETGSWTHDPRYNDPPGACPGDQPPAGYDGVMVPKA